MILDLIFGFLGNIANLTIGGILRLLGDPVTLDAGTTVFLAKAQDTVYLVDQFLPISEINLCLNLIAVMLTLWFSFKFYMWITEWLKIGKSWQE